MRERGSFTFGDPGGYAAGFCDDARVDLAIAGPGAFKARLTRLNLEHLEIYFCSECLPRIAYISLSSGKAFLSLPVNAESLVFNGFLLCSGDVVLHRRGEHFHQRTGGACQWVLLSLPHEQLASCSKALMRPPITSPLASRIFRPPHPAALRFRDLLRQACQLADLKQELIERPGAAKALEQELIHAMIHCLAGDEAEEHPATRRHQAAMMLRFEEALHMHADEKLSLPALCAEAGVAERTLRMCCAKFLGVSPTRYLLLRRLNRARATLTHAHASTTSVADVARDNQFGEPGRFAVTYRTTFGELPSVTLHRNP